MAAEVDFGDQELFEQLDADEAPPVLATQPPPLHTRFEEADEEAEELRERLRECEEKVRALQAENGELKRKLKILTRPSGLTVDDSKLEGPLLQILFMNNTITKQCHHEVEDFISSLVQRYEEQQRAESDRTTFNVKPQPSSFILEDDHNVETTNTSKKIKEAFSVVGSVLYFANFCLDKLGQPILNENPQLTDGWEIPKYQQVFTQILSLEGQEIQVKPKRPKAHCFNCGSEDHQMKDCLQPRNAARISEKRKQFLDACGEAGNQNFQQRYHADEVEERFGRFKPGIISDELQDALGVTEKTLPPFIYRMRQLGYPPGWLKEAEMEKSGLTLYDGKASPGDEPDKEEHYQQNQNITYDTSKLINYPGFNISTPSGVADEWRLFGSVPLQPSQQKEIFAHYLSTYHSATLKSSSKRHSSHQSSHHSKRHKGNSAEVPVADMEMDSDIEIPPCSPSHDGFQFQPPLPPGSPQIPTPPPLPRGTPPCTPPSFTPPHPPTCTPSPLPRDTPPLTPSSNSPALRAEGSAVDEDTLTLEELEEQQRLIWAALEQADSANSDSDFPAGTPLTGNSVASSPTRVESDVVLEEIACQNLDKSEPGLPGNSDERTKAEEPEKKLVSANELVSEQKQIPAEELVSEKKILAEELVSEKMQISADELIDLTEEPEPKQVSTGELVDLTEDDVPSHADSEGTVENWPSTSECGLNHSKDLSDPPLVASFSAPSKNASPVPDMSKFAAGITPFEFENMAESTGVYLRIRKVLKNSPRNQQRNKNASV